MPTPFPKTQQDDRLKKAYLKYRREKRLFLCLLFPVLLFSFFSSILVGSADISLKEIWTILWIKICNGVTAESNTGIIIWNFRLPRISMGFLAGGALGASGAVMQVVLRNPLADPYICGIAASAGFGASLAIIFGVGIFAGPYMVIGNAFLFSLLSATIILVISARKESSPQTIILAGIALLFFFQALTTILQYFGDSDAVKAAVFWAIGDLGRVGWDEVAIVVPFVVLGIAFLCWQSRDLNLITAGDETAKSLGINVARVRILSMVISTGMVAGIVSFTGTIGFVGLISPHIVRFLTGNDNKILVPASGMLGAILLITSDTLARTILSPVILPVGTVTAFLGVPLFVYLIIFKNETLQ